MVRILLVDDDTAILDGLRRSLYCMRSEWHMQFANSGAAALQLLEYEPADVVVSDMRMPGMDGSHLLGEVKRRYPETVRLILSGHADAELIIRATGNAHQYLTKPCEAAVLKAAISRTQNLKTLLSSERLAHMVGAVETLPSPPRAYQALLDCFRDPASTLGTAARIIQRDTAMTANILKLSNSAFFGVRSPVNSVERAIEFIGGDAIAALVMGYGVFSASTRISLPGFSLENLGQHSFETAACARAIARCEKLAPALIEAAFLTGVLHDVGRVVFAIREPPSGSHNRDEWIADSRMQMEAHHAEIGAYLLGLWGFSDTIVEAIAWHHTPSRASDKSFGLCGILHVADCLAHKGHQNGQTPDVHEVEPGYLKSVDMSERWPEWEAAVLEGSSTESALC